MNRIIFLVTSYVESPYQTAIRDTWAKQLPPQSTLLFVVGRPDAHEEIVGDILYVRADDGYLSVADKLYKAIKFLYLKSEFDYLFVCDDDNYIVMPRLLETDYARHDAYGAGPVLCCGCHSYHQGGAGYFLSRAAAASIADYPADGPILKESHFSDLFIGRLLDHLDIAKAYNSNFNWGLVYEEQHPADPTPDNQIIARHKIPARRLYASDQVFRPYPIRVSFVVDNWARGGASIEFENFIKHADPNKFEFVGAALHTPWKMEHSLHFPVYTVHRDAGRYSGPVHEFYCWEQAVAAATENADIILTWGIHYPWYPPSDVPVVLMNKGRGEWADDAVRITTPHASHYVANSRGCVDSFASDLRDRVQVIYSGIEPERLVTNIGREGQRKEWDLSSGDKVVGFVGRLTRDKGIFELIMAVSELPPEWKLVLAGEFRDESVKRAAIELCETQIPGRYRIAPWKEPVGDILAAIDVFVLICPNEGFSNALGEAWLAGVPTVYSPTGAVLELVERYGELGVRAELSSSPAEIASKILEAVNVDTRLAKQMIGEINAIKGAQDLSDYLENVYRTHWSSQPIKVGFVFSTLSTGGAEQINLNILKGCSRNRVAFSCVKVFNPSQPTDPDVLGEFVKYANLYITKDSGIGEAEKSHPRVFVGDDDGQTVATFLEEIKPDIIVTWGVSNLPDLIPHSGIPVVYLSMCNNEWQRERLDHCLTLCNAPAALSKVAARDFEGRTTSEPSILYSGISPKRCLPSLGRMKQRELWGVKDDEILLGYVGRMGHEKDCTAMARALKHLPSQYRGVLVGYREDQFWGNREDLEGVEDRIIKVPPVEDVGDVLAAIDVLFNCSEQEGFGMSCVEAWYTGTPVVSTRVGIQEELTEDYSTIVPYQADGTVLARAVSQSLSPEGLERTDRAMRLVWNNFLTQTMCARWTRFFQNVHERSSLAATQDRIKLYATYTDSHAPLLDQFTSSLKDDYELHVEKLEVQSNGDHHSDGWFDHNIAKMRKIIQSIDDNIGKIIIWSDVDIRFYQSTKDTILSLMEGRDIVFQADSNMGVNWKLCTGFMSIRCTQKTRALFVEVLGMIRPKDGFDDQFAISQILHRPGCDVAWAVLPDKFWSWSIISDYVPDDIVLHHTTCTQETDEISSVESKKRQMSQVLDHFSPLNDCLLIVPSHGMAQLNRWLVGYLPRGLSYVVVDNNGSWPTDVCRPPLDVIRPEENLNWVGSINEAVYKHINDYSNFIVIDNDIKPSIGLFHALLRCRRDTGAGLVGPMVDNVSPEYPDQKTSCTLARHYFGNPVYKRVGSLSKHCFLVGREVFSNTGFFDETFATCSSGAMDDFCIRAKLAGHKIFVSEGGFVEHYHGGGMTKKHQFWHRNGFFVEDAKYWLLREKHGPDWDHLRLSHEPTNMDFLWVFAQRHADHFSREDAEWIIQVMGECDKAVVVSEDYSRLLHVVNAYAKETHAVGCKAYPQNIWRTKLSVYPCDVSQISGNTDLLVVEKIEDYDQAVRQFRARRIITRFEVTGLKSTLERAGLYYYAT